MNGLVPAQNRADPPAGKGQALLGDGSPRLARMPLSDSAEAVDSLA
jgi:hypothetical protein